MILIQTYDADGRTLKHEETCDGIRFLSTPFVQLNEPPVTPIIKRFYTDLTVKWSGYKLAAVPEGGTLLMCYCDEDPETGRLL